jgi:hypothetical protein
MQALSTALESFRDTLRQSEQTPSLSPMRQPGLTSSDGKTIMQPKRQSSVTPESVTVSMHSMLREIALSRKFETEWIASEGVMRRRKSYGVSSLTGEQRGALEHCLRLPTFETLLPHLKALMIIKKVQDMGGVQAEAYLRIIFDALQEIPEAALVMGMRSIRNDNPSPWFPTIAEIKAEAKYYAEIYKQLYDDFEQQ